MSRNFLEKSHSLSSPHFPNELHFTLLNQMDTPKEWKSYSESYPHLASDDYFWKKLMIKFPELTYFECQAMHWFEALVHVDFNFTLKYAYETDDFELMNEVLNYVGNVYQLDKKNGFFMFFTLVQDKKFDMARLFLNKRYNIDTFIYEDRTPLMYCVGKNNIESAHFLLEHGADANAVSTQFASALYIFCLFYAKYLNDDMFKLLTDYGADYNLKNNNNEVALHAFLSGIKRFIFDKNSVEEISSIKRMFTLVMRMTDTSIVDAENATFLHFLCFIYKKIKMNERITDHHMQDHIIRLFKILLIEFINAGISIHAETTDGKTAYDYICDFEDDPMCEQLRQNGALNARS